MGKSLQVVPEFVKIQKQDLHINAIKLNIVPESIIG
jgi:stage V sporulation protein SpoVS